MSCYDESSNPQSKNPLASFLSPVDTSEQSTLCSDLFFGGENKPYARSTVPPSPQKVTPFLRCSLVNALKTLRLAIHFLRDTCGAGISFITQTQTYGRQFVMSCRLFFIMPRHKWDPFRPTLIK